MVHWLQVWICFDPDPCFLYYSVPSQVRLLDCRSTWQHKTNVVVGFSSAGILQFQTYAKRNTKACSSLQCIEVWVATVQSTWEARCNRRMTTMAGMYAVLCLHSRDDEGHLKFICYGRLASVYNTWHWLLCAPQAMHYP